MRSRALPRRARPDDDAAAGPRCRGVAPVLPPSARARREPRPARAFDGHLAGFPRRRRRRSDAIRVGSILWSASTATESDGATNIPASWALQTSGAGRSSTSASPRRTRRLGRGRLRDARGARADVRRAPERAPPAAAPPARQRVRRLDRGGAARAQRTACTSAADRGRAERNLEVAPEPSPSVQVHLVVPRWFNDAQQIADKLQGRRSR